MRSTNAIESLLSNVRQRTGQIDAFTTAHELPDHCAGGDAGYAPAQDSAGSSQKREKSRQTSSYDDFIACLLSTYCTEGLTALSVR
ncbi:MAG TPA: hypothetical protein VKR83_01090 [Ktedonobacteraceae bacterium]|nr:hypothetical protein [Ktedonobacteraceae bacterium]